MQLLDHVSISVPDIDPRPFYDAIMAALGAAKVYDRPTALGYGERCSANDTASTFLAVYLDPAEIGASKRHWCFAASREQVEAFSKPAWRRAGSPTAAACGRSTTATTTARLVDPAGNRVEAVCHASVPASAS